VTTHCKSVPALHKIGKNKPPRIEILENKTPTPQRIEHIERTERSKAYQKHLGQAKKSNQKTTCERKPHTTPQHRKSSQFEAATGRRVGSSEHSVTSMRSMRSTMRDGFVFLLKLLSNVSMH